MRRVPPLFLAFFPLAACSNTPAPISIDITTGQETTAFTDAKATRVDIAISSPIDASLVLTAQASPDGGTFDFGNIPNTEQITVKVSAVGPDGSTPVMAGQSLVGLALSSVAGDLPVFIQQKAHWARPPGSLQCSHVGGTATVKEDRSFLLTGGANARNDTTSCQATGMDSYDMLALGGDATAQPYGKPPATIVSLVSDNGSDSLGLFISAEDGVFWDYNTGSQYTGCTPGFAAWADVAGGAVIAGSGSSWFVVGGARSTGSATNAVLAVDPDCATSQLSLATKRRGAATAWIDNVGLVVVAGNSDSTGPGLEIPYAAPMAPSYDPQYAADPTVGAAIVADGTGILMLGGMIGTTPQPPRFLPLTCAMAQCTSPQSFDVAGLPGLANASAFLLAAGSALLIGEDAAGMTRSFVIDFGTPNTAPTAMEALLREPRSGATAITSPNGAIAILGGQHADGTPALSIELFEP